MTEQARVSKIGVANPTLTLEAFVDADLDTLVTALYVKIDDSLVKDRRPGRPARLSQSELVCLAVAQALLGLRSEHRWSEAIPLFEQNLAGAMLVLGTDDPSTLTARNNLAGACQAAGRRPAETGDPAGGTSRS